MNLDKKKFLDSFKGPLFEGRLEAFSEQGSEGTHWALYDNQVEKGDGYHRLHMIEDGDYLVVFKGGSILWEGTVTLRNRIRQMYLPQYGTIHGIQKGMKPEKWAEMFFRSLDAYVVKKV